MRSKTSAARGTGARTSAAVRPTKTPRGILAPCTAEVPSLHLYPVDGAAHRVGPDETTWACHDAAWSGVIGGIDPTPANAGLARQWCVDY